MTEPPPQVPPPRALRGVLVAIAIVAFAIGIAATVSGSTQAIVQGWTGLVLLLVGAFAFVAGFAALAQLRRARP